jgi:sialic acid synthase SpsE
MRIGNKEIKNFGEPFIIAEIGSNHNGKLELARQMVDAAVDSGADAVKFQSFDTNLFSKVCYETDERRIRVMQESAALNKFFTNVHPELKKEMEEYEATTELMREMKRYCDQKGTIFCCTPFNEGAVDFLVDELNVAFIKIASMDVNNPRFLEYIARKNKPMILSTGMASMAEITEAADVIKATGNNQLILLHCVSTYPPKDENINLNNLELLRNSFDCPIGWSDHTLGYSVCLASAAKGACVIEKHFTLDKNLPGWDHKVSATPDELKIIVQESKRIWQSLGSYNRVLPQDEIDKRALFRRSLIIKNDMQVGDVIREEDLSLKRPGIGIEPKDAKFVIGRALKKQMKADDLVRFEDLI